jgi:hypothetical protein
MAAIQRYKNPALENIIPLDLSTDQMEEENQTGDKILAEIERLLKEPRTRDTNQRVLALRNLSQTVARL